MRSLRALVKFAQGYFTILYMKLNLNCNTPNMETCILLLTNKPVMHLSNKSGKSLEQEVELSSEPEVLGTTYNSCFPSDLQYRSI
jgi:hypothetical protein